MAYSREEVPVIPPEAMRILTKAPLRGKGASVYSIISAQAGGVSDALLRALAASKLDEFKGAIKTYLDWYDDKCELARTSLTPAQLKTLKTSIWNNIVNDGAFLIDAWKAGLGLQMGTAFMGLVETYRGYPQLLSMFLTEKLDASIRPKIEAYWLSTYTPNYPSSSLAFHLLMEGQISRAEFNRYCSYEGWSTTFHDKLYEVYNRDPDEYMAFSMFKRGLITEAKMKSLFRIRGYDASYDTALYQVLHRRPSFRELTSLSDFVPLPDMWISEVLRANGYLETDINYITTAIRLRPLREETRSVIGRYLWEYQIGRLDRETLKKNLTPLCQNPKELELNLLWGDLRYADELIDESLDIIEARVQAGDPLVQTTDTIKAEIVALGIAEEKANLMAELWYYQYVYVPPP